MRTREHLFNNRIKKNWCKFESQALHSQYTLQLLHFTECTQNNDSFMEHKIGKEMPCNLMVNNEMNNFTESIVKTIGPQIQGLICWIYTAFL